MNKNNDNDLIVFMAFIVIIMLLMTILICCYKIAKKDDLRILGRKEAISYETTC